MVFNKRGIGGEIDWILGMGLFLITLVFIFILFKPGVTPVYDSETLLTILQDGFQKDIFWNITTTPVFVYPVNNTIVLPDEVIVNFKNKKTNLSCVSADGTCTPVEFTALNASFPTNIFKENIEVYYLLRSATDASLTTSGYTQTTTTAEDPTTFCDAVRTARSSSGSGTGGHTESDQLCPALTPTATNPNQQERETRRREARDRIGTQRGQDSYRTPTNHLLFTYDSPTKILTLPVKIVKLPLAGITPLTPNKTKYLVAVSSKPLNFNTADLVTAGTSIKDACFTPDSIGWPSQFAGEICPLVYEQGVTETFKGIDLFKFFNLELTQSAVSTCTSGYDCVKQQWGLPLTKEFTLELTSIPYDPTSGFRYVFPNGSASPPKNVNVFVREFNEFILTDDAKLVPVKVRLKIW